MISKYIPDILENSKIGLITIQGRLELVKDLFLEEQVRLDNLNPSTCDTSEETTLKEKQLNLDKAIKNISLVLSNIEDI